jgi:hypothetical protein
VPFGVLVEIIICSYPDKPFGMGCLLAPALYNF